jgi:hypothetical protein
MSGFTAINRALKKYGKAAFKSEVLVKVPNKLLNQYETTFIAAFSSNHKEFGYNMTSGGDENPMHNPGVRAKHSATWSKPEVREKHKKRMKMVMQNDAVRDAISKSMKALLGQPGMREKRSQQVAQTWADGDRIQRASNIKAALALPMTKAKQKNGIKDALNDPVIKARHVAALKKNAKNPETQQKKRAAMQEFWRKKKAGLI